MNDYYESGYKEGFAEGVIIGLLEIGLKKVKNMKREEQLAIISGLVSKDIYTVFEGQQLLFYSRLGIYEYKKGKEKNV